MQTSELSLLHSYGVTSCSATSEIHSLAQLHGQVRDVSPPTPDYNFHVLS